MSNYVVDITGSTPPASTVAWTSAQLSESADRSGPFTQIDTFTLTPDVDPTLPAARSFHSENATLPSGWYVLTWLDPSGDQYVSDPIWAGYGLRPAVQEVARLMPDRTTIDGATEAGTFNSQTQPTDIEVNGLIDVVLDSIAPLISTESAISERAGRWVVALKVAQLIEIGRFGEQRDVNDARLAAWQNLINTNMPTATGGGVTTPVTLGDPWVMSGPAPADAVLPLIVDGEIVP